MATTRSPSSSLDGGSDIEKPAAVYTLPNSPLIHEQVIEIEIQTKPPPKTRSRLRLAVILVALYLSVFVAALDQTINATAIPTISASLHSAAGYTWIGGAYLLANASSSPIWGKLSDIWGRKPILLISVALFAGSSLVCAVATSMGMLIAGRALQGTAGGGLIQLANITISDLFSVRRRILFLGCLGAMWALAGGLGPILGGALSEKASWRWCYWINLPVCGSTFVLLFAFLDVHNPRTRMVDGLKAIDWLGCFSILGTTLMLLLGLEFGGETFPWNSVVVICLLVFGALMAIVFVLDQKLLAKYPLMPLSLFHHKSNIASLLLTFIHGMVFIAGEYYLPLYFQSVKGASPLMSGVLVLPITITEGLGGIFCGFFINRYGRYLDIIYVGTILLTLGTGLYIHLSTSSSILEIVIFELVAGAGAAVLFEPPLISLQAHVSQDDTATATATFGFVRSMATSISIVLGGVVFQNSMTLREPTLLSSGISSELAKKFTGSEAAANVLLVNSISDEQQREVIRSAFSWSMRNMWILYTALAATGLIAGCFIRKKKLSKEHTETVTGIKESKPREAPQWPEWGAKPPAMEERQRRRRPERELGTPYYE